MIKKYDLAVVIAARNEEFLARTVESILENKRGNTQVIVICDGSWPDPPVKDNPDLTLIYHAVSVGQRAACNEGAKLASAEYIMKLDAHCIVAEGFDVAIVEEMKEDYTMIPIMYNLHAFNWRCKKCGNEWYQGAIPTECLETGESRKKNEACDSTEFERVIVWEPRWHRKNTHYRFDENLKFQYWGALKKRPEIEKQGVIADSMSAQGSCFILTKKKWFELNICDENWGSWGQQGTEVACKTWLSGGRLVINKRTWYAHMFRTQQGFGFPYPQSGRQMMHARSTCSDIFFNNKYEKQIYPLSWLINKFKPIPDWHDPKGKEALQKVLEEGEKFNKRKEVKMTLKIHQNKPTKGIIYYTDNQLNLKIARACQRKIKESSLPIFSSSLKPMNNMGENVSFNTAKRSYLTYFRQILAALELCTTDIVFFCEHDCLYHPSHFKFTPPRKDVYYYNDNWWRLRFEDGHAVHYDTHLKISLCCYRELALQHHRKLLDKLTKEGVTTNLVMRIGFEPGTHRRAERIDDFKAEGWKSEYPIIDIRHEGNLTASRWSQDQFRNQRNCQNWKETKEIPGWENWQKLFK